MREVIAKLSIGYPNATQTETFYFEDDVTDEEVEATVTDWANNHISWYWEDTYNSK